MKFLVLIISFYVCFVSYAQNYDFKKFDDEVIKSSFIYQINQDLNGDLWIAHSKGLIIYDGLEFKLFDKKNGLIENFIEQIEVDSLNRIWFSYYNGGYGYINDDKIYNLDSSHYVTDIKINPEGIVYLSTQNKILTFNDTQKDSIEVIAKQIEFLDNHLMLSLDAEGNLFTINPKNDSHKLLSDVKFLSSSSKKNMALCVVGDDLLIIKIKDKGEYQTLNKVDLSTLTSNISNVELYSNLLEVSSIDNGVLEFKFNADFTSYTIKNYNKQKGLPSNKIYTSFLDLEKNLWFGSYGDGLFMLPNSRISIFNNGVSNETINAIEGVKNALYLATEHGVVKTKGNFNQTDFLLKNVSIQSLKRKGDELWIGTKDKGLYLYKNGKLSHFEFTSDVKPKSINCIQFEEGAVVVGTNTGLYLYNFTTKETKHITTNEGLAHNVIESFIIDKSRTFWFDSPNSPLYSYQDGKFIYYKNIEGFSCFNITDIIQLENGEIWFSTAGDGVFKYFNNNFLNYTINDGLFTNYVYFVSETSYNTVLLGHKKGITIIENSDSIPNIHHLGNINELEFILPKSYYLAGQKNLWVGTSTGLVNIPLNYIHSTHYQPKLFFKSIQISSDTLKAVDSINLDYGNYYIDISFKAVYLSNPQAISYKWKLEGFDKNWNIGKYNDNKARYQSLKDGTYKFIIKLYVNDTYSGQSKYIIINIEKPYWKQIWFYALLVVVLILTIVLSFYLYNKRNIKLRKILVKKVDERTKALNVKNTELKLLSQEYLKEKNIVEYQSKELLKSINYARRIQKGMLRKPIYIKWQDSFKDIFLIYKPKDKVSGDFYWAYKKEDFIYIAVGDCTGHGVPGAMISMLGISTLTEVITTRSEPNLILNDLREKVVNQLGSIGSLKESLNVRDGMDIALFRYDIKTKIGQSASAYNPIYILRSKSIPIDKNLKIIVENDDVILYSTIADKQPIGVCVKMNPFTLNTFQLYSNDQVFMFSDGYYDQFGGPKNKKFLRKKFNQLILKTHGLSGNEQKEMLASTLDNWMEGYEQIDDITVLGFIIE